MASVGAGDWLRLGAGIGFGPRVARRRRIRLGGSLALPWERPTPRPSGALALEVDLVEAAVEGGAAAEFAVGADGFDAAGVHQDDAVGELE